MILEFKQRKGGSRWEESDGEPRGFGIGEAILEAGIDLVVPSWNWTRYCGEMVGSIGMSTTVWSFRNGGISANGDGELFVVNEETIFRGVNEVTIIPKLSTSGQAMQFFGCELRFRLRCIGGITRTNRWEGRVRVMES